MSFDWTLTRVLRETACRTEGVLVMLGHALMGWSSLIHRVSRERDSEHVRVPVPVPVHALPRLSPSSLVMREKEKDESVYGHGHAYE
jgi:hypothetical protein